MAQVEVWGMQGLVNGERTMGVVIRRQGEAAPVELLATIDEQDLPKLMAAVEQSCRENGIRFDKRSILGMN